MPAFESPKFSFGLFILLTAVFAASWTMFWLLVRRDHRPPLGLLSKQWGRHKKLKLRRHDVVADWRRFQSRWTKSLRPRGRPSNSSASACSLVQVEPSAVSVDRPLDPAAGRFGTRWNLLIRRSKCWPATALRPVNASAGVIDLFSLGSYPTMIPPERFMIFGVDSTAARAVAKSALTSLLPPDIGLLLHGPYLVLDFTGRPFDDIELDRMLVLADQLTTFLPQAPTPSAS